MRIDPTQNSENSRSNAAAFALLNMAESVVIRLNGDQAPEMRRFTRKTLR